MKRIAELLGLLILLLILVFALSNRQPAHLSLWPLGLSVDMPLAIALLLALVLGLLMGGGLVWVKTLPLQFRVRQLTRDLAKARKLQPEAAPAPQSTRKRDENLTISSTYPARPGRPPMPR